MIYNLTNISFTLNTMIALELNWLTLVMSSDPIDIIDVTYFFFVGQMITIDVTPDDQKMK